MALQRASRAPRVLPWTGIAAAGLSPVLIFVISQSDGWARWALALSSGIATAYAGFCTYYVSIRSKKASATATLSDDKSGAIEPTLVQFLHDLCVAPDVHTRGQVIGRLREFAVASARGLGGDDTRVAVYRFKPHGETECLERDGYRGRHGERPRKRFCACLDSDNQPVIDLAKGDTGYLSRDITVDTPRGMTNPGSRSYRSLMLMPIHTADRPIGLISVDDPAPGVFGSRQLVTLEALARCLAACEALDAPQGAGPPVRQRSAGAECG